MSITFAVSDVAAPEMLLPALDRTQAITSLIGMAARAPQQRGSAAEPAAPFRGCIEAFSTGSGRLVAVTEAHALATAAYGAFHRHHPLVLSPDAVWFCIAQGFAQHIALHAETLRSQFVRHQGVQTLVIERYDFYLGQPNPWPEAFAEFSEQIASHVGRLRDLVVADFSTTGPVERAASEVVLMHAFQPYFAYEMLCSCGIPSITLLGTADDWRSIRRRAAMLSEFGLEEWIGALLPVLDEVVRTAEGDVDPGFWRSFFRYQSSSGSSELTGWILLLFPYITQSGEHGREIVANPYMASWERAVPTAQGRIGWAFKSGPDLNMLPGSIASVPVQFIDVRDDSRHPLRFVAGLFGVTQDVESGALAPEFGWGIVHDDAA